MRFLGRAVYASFGVLAVLLGALALIRPNLALPPDASSPLTMHLVREQGAEGIFIGLMALWCYFHFESRRPVHLALMLFSFLFAMIHWLEYFEGRRTLLSPIFNSVPLVLFIVTAPWSAVATKKARVETPKS